MKKIIKYCVFAFVMLTYVATASKLSYAEEKQKVTVINNKGTKVDTYEVSKTQVNEEKELKPVVPSNLNENTNSKLFKSASTYKVIGQDTRTLISNTHAYPYTAIARLTMTFNGISGVYHGTGFVIGSNVLATAGHCLVQVDSNGNKHGLKSLKVEFGYNQYSGAYRTENGWSQCIYYGDYTKL